MYTKPPLPLTAPRAPSAHARPSTVADLMTYVVFSASVDDALDEALATMLEEEIRHLPVVDEEGNLIGILSHRDLLAAGQMRTRIDEEGDLTELGRSLAGWTVRQAMHAADAVTPDTPLAEAAALLLDNKYGCVPVVENQRLIGILSESDFVRTFVPLEAA